ncbi:MAG: PadR family transcriptional regulator [Nocardioidaceae bacterium]|nr:PadR family transcriptional regulator [Nocardioidaceae bacterium]NUS52322.1 PadR family transcriptional regulator [Nocardioidaceae bacterium]
MSAAHALLALLEREPAHGYTLKQRYDERFARGRRLAFGQVYASLARFEKQGWAEVTEVVAGDGPERKLYRITGEGVTVVDRWVFEPQQPAEFSDSTLFARVSVALMSGRSAADVLDTQRATHLERMRALTEARRTADPADVLAITYELAHLDADLRWIEEAGARLTDARQALLGTDKGARP